MNTSLSYKTITYLKTITYFLKAITNRLKTITKFINNSLPYKTKTYLTDNNVLSKDNN